MASASITGPSLLRRLADVDPMMGTSRGADVGADAITIGSSPMSSVEHRAALGRDDDLAAQTVTEREIVSRGPPTTWAAVTCGTTLVVVHMSRDVVCPAPVAEV